MNALITFLALLAIFLCIAIISIATSKRRNKSTRLDNEIFRRRDE